MLGPGTLLSAALIALAGWWLLDLPPAAAAILGAALASTDPVLLRGVLRRRDIPSSARQALQLESGLNDVVLLPVVVVAITLLGQTTQLDASKWAKVSLDLFILGPGAGVLVGLLGVAALDLVRKRLGVRRDYESLYSLGIAFTAFAAAEAVHGSGFLAAFTAGLTIAALDVELCDCFVEYGGVTAEMLLLFTFVLFGSSLIWSGLTIIDGATLLFAGIALLIRLPVYLASLVCSGVSKRGRLLIAWFGPRGLSSLLLILLPVFAGIPGSDRLFALCSLVVLLSVVLHGGSPLLLARAARKQAQEESADLAGEMVVRPLGPTPARPEASVQYEASDRQPSSGPVLNTSASSDGAVVAAKNRPACAFDHNASNDEPLVHDPQSIRIEELQGLQQSDEPVVILDVRTERSRETSETQAQGAVRMPPDHARERAKELGLEREAWLVAYCA